MSLAAKAEITLPRLVDNGMVLQRNTEVNIWGWANPNSKITITPSWSKEKITAQSDKNGDWIAKVATTDAAVDQSVTIAGDGSNITLSDISLGEVWICSGQSNMEMKVSGFSNQPVYNAVDLLLESNQYPNLRLFAIPRTGADEPAKDCISTHGWVKSTPEHVGNFSAVATYYGRVLSRMLDIPIGLIQTAYGGTRIEAWMSVESIESIEGIDLKSALNGKNERTKAAGLYNAMILPIVNYTAKGFIWYQGESNRAHPANYTLLMPKMVELWRKDWGDKTMPFYYVQLAPFTNREDPMLTSLPMMVEAQYKALKKIPYSGIAATTDVGSAQSIHPGGKRVVGERLAFMALRNDYGIVGLPKDAPTFKSMEVDGDKVTVSFNNVNKGDSNSLQHYDQNGALEIKGFEIAGEDKVFYPTDSAIAHPDNSNIIIISSDKVSNPEAIR